jgi:hypothetical protein
MTAVARQYGAAHRAFIVVPLVCGFFIDLLNALVINALVGLRARSGRWRRAHGKWADMICNGKPLTQAHSPARPASVATGRGPSRPAR